MTLTNFGRKICAWQEMGASLSTSMNASTYVQGKPEWWGLVVIVGSHRVVGCLGPCGGEAHNHQMSKSGTMDEVNKNSPIRG